MHRSRASLIPIVNTANQAAAAAASNVSSVQFNDGMARNSSLSNASVFSLADIEEHLYRNNNNLYHNHCCAHLDESNPVLCHNVASNNVSSRISMETPSAISIPIENNNSQASTLTPPPPPPPLSHRNRANSTISLAKTRIHILAMLDEVRKKRFKRRQSDLMAYLDDLIVSDDPLALATGASKRFKRRYKIYQFLNHPCTGAPWSITYHVLVFVVVFICLMLTICATIQKSPLQEKAIRSVYLLEKVVIIWFCIEFFLGIWSCSCKKRYRGFVGRVRYLTVPSRLIDMIVLSLTTLVLIFNPSKTGHEVFVVSAFRGFHRFFQVAQVLTLNRPLKPWKVLASVIYDQREQLFIILYTEFIVLCTLAYVAFLVERDTNENFNSIADSMWWAIVTLSTVGYGDRVPVTWIGKIISSMFTILGVAIFALPAGIIGTGLALKIEEVERNQIRNRKKRAATILIQRAWRCWKAHTTYELVSKFFRGRPMAIYKNHHYISTAHKFLALVQLFVARNRFRELMRPLDVKMVMQSYSDGQTEVLLRTKLIQQSIEELTRRVEMSENRVGNMSMRVETKQNTFEQRINHIRQLLESCHRQLLANHLLVELLRGNNNRLLQNRKNHKQKPRYNSQNIADRLGMSRPSVPFESRSQFPSIPFEGQVPQITISDYATRWPIGKVSTASTTMANTATDPMPPPTPLGKPPPPQPHSRNLTNIRPQHRRMSL